MKILFISNYKYNNEKDGVAKKIKSEMSAFENLGCQVDYVYVEKQKVYLKEENERYYLCEMRNKFAKSWNMMFKELIKHIEKNVRYDFVYIRQDYLSCTMIHSLRKIKENKMRIYLEVPTVMGKCEPGASIKSRVAFCYKRFFLSCFLSKFVSKVVTFSDDDYLYGIPTIKIENGVDAKNMPIFRLEKNKNCVELIAVAIMTPAHGFDRVISGIYDFVSSNNNTKPIHLTIVGDGPDKNHLERLTNELKLNEYVDFVGLRSSKELDYYFSRADLAIASMAIHRKKTKKCSELKIREYFGRGIPFIYSADEPILDVFEGKYCKKVPLDESPININTVMEFVETFDYINYPIEMHNIACANFCWESQLTNVITEFREAMDQ